MAGFSAVNKGAVQVASRRVLCTNVEFTLRSSARNLLRDSASICSTFVSIRVLRASFTPNCSSLFSHMSGTRQTRPRRVASDAKVKREEGGSEDRMYVPQETVEALQSYAFRPTGKRKDYKSEETSEGKCNSSNILRRRFFHCIGASVSRKEGLCLSNH